MATVTITVTEVNDNPTVSNITVSTNEDTPIEITLTGTDVDGDLLTFSVTDPSNGTVSLEGAVVTYTPNSNFNGTDTFTYTANDGTLNSETATVNITVISVNTKPTVSNVNVSTNEDTSLEITLTGTDVDGDVLTFSVTEPSNGTVSLEGSVVTYIPNPNFNGTDTFTYTANDGTLNSETATVNIIVISIDTDGDGVSDDRDLCNDTPLGVAVNTDGCEILTLPNDNYIILTNGVSCSGKSNGKITISVVNTEYTYVLSIDETQATYSLDADNEHQLEIDELEIGTYTLNFTVEGKAYLQTFEIGITEPPSLSAKSSVNQKGKTMTVNLTGSDLYYAEVNGERRSYQINTFTLQLRPGMNTVRIYTPQDCQGEYVEQVFISEQVRHYPNPVKSDLNLVIPGEDSNTTISIYSRSGRLVAQYEETIPLSRIVTLNASQLPSDIYVIKVNGQTVDQTFKIIKR